MSSPTSTATQFEPFRSAADPTFWSAFASRKIELDKLDESASIIRGQFSTSARDTIPPRLLLSGDFSFTPNPNHGAVSVPVPVLFRNFNTREAFASAPYAAWAEAVRARVWASILSGRALAAPWLVTPACVLSFANLKTHVFYYRLGLPAAVNSSFSVTHHASSSAPVPAASVLSPTQRQELVAGASELATSAPHSAFPAAFVVMSDEGTGKVTVAPLTSLATLDSSSAGDAAVRAAIAREIAKPATVGSAPSFALAITDPSAATGELGWTVLTVTALASLFLPAELLQRLPVLSFKDATVSARAHAKPIAEAVPLMSTLSVLTVTCDWPSDVLNTARKNSAELAAQYSHLTPSAVASAAAAAAGDASATRTDLPSPVDIVAADEQRAVSAFLSALRSDAPETATVPAAPESLATSLSTLLPALAADGLVSWERNERGAHGPRVVNLSAQMDPRKVMESSVDLNLKLMRWRLLPNLDLQRISNTKVLLVGSGTLGCNVARALLAWGVHHFTFLDNSRVASSNPVRQTLFTAADCNAELGGRPKALAAALGLKSVYPGVSARAVNISIPMPGHGAGTASASAAAAGPTRTRVPVPALVKGATGVSTIAAAAHDADEDCVEFISCPDSAPVSTELLSSLVAEADAVFLLTDSRESRWLPTLLAQAYDKLCINAAMGFDTFVVMRHGARPRDAATGEVDWSGQPQFGCYFCADIVTPANSLRDRSLDQQCTVTRPGLSMITSALAAEVGIAAVQHKEGARAPAIDDDEGDADDVDSATNGLGALPQQVRGSLRSIGMTHMRASSHSACCACGTKVVAAVRDNSCKFVQKVAEEAMYLDEFSGLAEIRRRAEEVACEWDASDHDDNHSKSEEGGEEVSDESDFGFE